MKCKKVFFVLFLLSLQLSFIYAEDFNPKNYKSAKIRLEFTGEAEITGDFEEINLVNPIIPQETERQSVSCEGYQNFTWKDEPVMYSYTCEVETEIYGEKTQDGKFPVKNVPPEIESYLEQTEYTQIEPEVGKIALSLSEGTDSSFEVSGRIVKWVSDNIEYDLNYAKNVIGGAEGRDSTAMDTYTEKRGVCGEMAQLGIAMLREVGIPARYAGGNAFGNLGEDGQWLSHAWIEAYIDGGWVPFDPAFREYGWIDPFHIKYYNKLDGRPELEIKKTTYRYLQGDNPPKIIWTEQDEETILEMEEGKKFGLEIFMDNSSYYNEPVLLEAEVENLLPGTLYAAPEIFYTASNLDKNFGLLWGSKSQGGKIEGGDKKSFFWVLETPELESAGPGRRIKWRLPITVRLESGEVENKTIEFTDGPHTTELEVLTDKSAYKTGEPVKLTVFTNSEEKTTFTELSSGKKGEAEGQYEFRIPANENMAVFSSTHDFKEVEPNIGKESVLSSITGPGKVSHGELFNISISLRGAGNVAITYEDGKRTFSAPGTIDFEKKAEETKTYEFILQTGEKETILTKRVEVLPKPDFEYDISKTEFAEGEKAKIRIRGPRITVEKDGETFEGEGEVIFYDESPACGKNSLRLILEEEDSLGKVFREEKEVKYTVYCGFDAIMIKIRRFIENLTGIKI